MPVIDTRIDEYIDSSPDFAKPILIHLRNIIHAASPAVKETMKWSFPHFEYAGSILCNMAAFKQHCAFGFWLGSLLTDPNKLLEKGGEKTSMGSLGQLKTLTDLPPDKVLLSFLLEAMSLNEKGVKTPKKERPASPKELEIPSYFVDLLQQNTTAILAFEKFSPSQKKEYVDWIKEAKTEATRNKRMSTALELLAEGKTKNWKYNKC